MADYPSLSVKDGQELVNKLAEVSANMRQAASLTDIFAQSIAQLYPGTVIAPQPTAIVTRKKRGRAPKEGKRIKDPNAPKRPATSYIMFQNDIRDELRRKYPQLSYKELLGKVSEAWAVLGEDQKKAYQNVADSNMAKYNRAVIDYKGSLNGHAAAASTSAAPTPEVDEADEEEEETEERPPTKKAKVTTAAPARPATESTDEDSDAASSVSDSSDEAPAAPLPPVKASKPTSSGKEKKKSKK